jgi:hypothetical protein
MRKINLWFVLAALLVMCGIVFAQAVAAPAAPEADPLGKRILLGALGGVIAALIGWAKNRDSKTNAQEPFSFKFLAITIAVGAIIGAIAGIMGKKLPEFFSQYESLPVWGMAMMGAEALLKALLRQSIGLTKMLGIVKEGSVNPPPPEPPKP